MRFATAPHPPDAPVRRMSVVQPVLHQAPPANVVGIQRRGCTLSSTSISSVLPCARTSISTIVSATIRTVDRTSRQEVSWASLPRRSDGPQFRHGGSSLGVRPQVTASKYSPRVLAKLSILLSHPDSTRLVSMSNWAFGDAQEAPSPNFWIAGWPPATGRRLTTRQHRCQTAKLSQVSRLLALPRVPNTTERPLRAAHRGAVAKCDDGSSEPRAQPLHHHFCVP